MLSCQENLGYKSQMPKQPNIDVLIESYDSERDDILSQSFNNIASALFQKIEKYGQDTNQYGQIVSDHLIRTSELGKKFLVERLDFSEIAGRNFYNANLLQDLGKTHFSYSPEIWRTKNRPTKEERLKKREHTLLGVELLDMAISKSPDALQQHPHIQVTKAIQRYHHERIDGTGYESVHGDDMGTVIKAVCIIDAFDGDMIHRPHQPKQRTPEEALDRLKNGEKYQGAFDKDILEQFIDFTLSGR